MSAHAVEDRRPSLAARLLLSAAAVFVSFTAIEVWARIEFSRGNARLTADASAAPAPILDPGHLRLADIVAPSPWPDLVYELRPNVSGAFLEHPYRSNAHGMRGADVSITKPPGVRRVAMVGDSFTFGWGVREEEGVVRVLEELLRGDPATATVEVLNFGVPGYNTAIEAAVVERRVLAFEPDVIVLQFFANDVFLPNFLLKPRPRPWSCAASFIGDRIDRMLAQAPRAAALEAPEDQGGHPMEEWRRDRNLVPPDLAYMVGDEGVRVALDRVATVTRSCGVPVLFVSFTLPTAIDVNAGAATPAADDSPDRAALAAAQELGFHVAASRGPIAGWLARRGKSVLDVVLSEQDWHYNATGNRLMAQFIANELRVAGWLGTPP